MVGDSKESKAEKWDLCIQTIVLQSHQQYFFVEKA